MTEVVERVGPGFTVLLDGPVDGERVLLLHGFPQDATSWDAVVRELAGRGRRCARFDQRGYTAAVRPPEVADYRLERLVDDAVQVLDGLGWPDAVVVGHDWGAVVAWAAAAAVPDRVARLVALSVPHPAVFAVVQRSDEDQRERSAYIRLFRVPGKAEDVLLADDARRLRRIFTGLAPEQAAHYVERFSDRATLTAALSWYRAVERSTMSDVAPVGVPVTYVWGAADVAVGRTAAEACGSAVTGPYRFVELGGGGHWVPETAPEAVVSAVVH